MAPEYGLGRGKVFPADKAASLLNPLRRLVQSPSRTVAGMKLAANARVLEVGCGPGFFSPSIAQAVPSGQVFLLDLQHEMRRLAGDRVAGALLVHSDAMALPLVDGAVDAVFVSAMLGEVPDRDRCVAEIRRVVRDGGHATFAETRRDSDFIPMPELQALVVPHGFELVERRGVRWQYAARFRAA